jgi:pyruvate dehydrogenase (quinone)
MIAARLSSSPVRLEMLVDGLPDYGTDHARVDYAAIAHAAGIESVRVE